MIPLQSPCDPPFCDRARFQNVESQFQQAISSLAALRLTVAKEMADAKWTLESHADREAPGFMQLAIADVAAVEFLATKDVRLIVPATAAARAAYEVVITCAWMLASADLAERDRRWMAMFLDERKYWRRLLMEAEARKDEQYGRTRGFTEVSSQDRRNSAAVGDRLVGRRPFANSARAVASLAFTSSRDVP